MTLRSHVAEIIRQGVWASLTGGWFYDPHQSLFCNTVHLYIWLVLFLYPLILGLAHRGDVVSWTMTLIYASVMTALFGLLKSAVWYLHRLFDTHQPLVVDKPIDEPAATAQQTSQQEVQVGRTTEEIELTKVAESAAEITSGLDSPQPTDLRQPSDVAGSSSWNNNDASSRAVLQIVRTESQRSIVAAQVHRQHASSDVGLKYEEEEEEGGSSSLARSDKSLLAQSTKIPVDSLELLPIGVGGIGAAERRASEAPLDERADDVACCSLKDEEGEERESRAMQRKFSEPSFELFGGTTSTSLRRRRPSGSGVGGVRRVRSTLETASGSFRQRSGGLILSQQTLEECKMKGTRKSYPSKTSSTDIFLSHARPPREQLIGRRSSSLQTVGDSAAELAADSAAMIAEEECEEEEEDEQAHPTSDAPTTSRMPIEAVVNVETPVAIQAVAEGQVAIDGEDEEEEAAAREMVLELRSRLAQFQANSDSNYASPSDAVADVPSRENIAAGGGDLSSWLLDKNREQLDMTLTGTESAELSGEAEVPTSSSIFGPAKAVQDQDHDGKDAAKRAEAASRRTTGLKIELARLLEEIIEKHPEALEAIESIRQRRQLSREDESADEKENEAGDDRETSKGRAVKRKGAVRRRSTQTTQDGSAVVDDSVLPPSTSQGEQTSENVEDEQTPRAGRLSGLAVLTAATSTSSHLPQDSHLAESHNDTAEGAVHCFRDEEGNWWTYTFNTASEGTAQALGSDDAVLDMIGSSQQQQEHQNRQQTQRSSGRAVAFPDFVGGSSAEEDLETGTARRRNKSRRSGCEEVVVRDSQLSSSRWRRRASEESSSDEFIAGVPSSVLHPSSVSQASSREPVTLHEAVQRIRALGPLGRRRNGAGGRERRLRMPSIPMGPLSMSSVRSHSVLLGNENRNRLQLMMGRTLSAAAQGAAGAAENIGVGGEAAAAASERPSSTGSGSTNSINQIRFLADLGVMSGGQVRRATETQRTTGERRSYYYKVKPFPKWFCCAKRTFTLKLDRLGLLALFDRNVSPASAALDLFLVVLVSLLCCQLLSQAYYYDLWLVAFSFLVAGSQFSLLKSVQPDAASPVHGYNAVAAYSRPAYFLLVGATLLSLDFFLRGADAGKYLIWNPYGWKLGTESQLAWLKNFLATLLLLLPIGFTLGLLPQANTFMMHLLEQVDMLLFGGTATFSLVSAAFSVAKSAASVLLLAIPCYCAIFWNAAAGGVEADVLMGALKETGEVEDATRSLYFSAFCALCVALGYLLSRSSSNPALLFALFRETSAVDGGSSEGKSEEEQQQHQRPQFEMAVSFKETLKSRLKHDLFCAAVLAPLVFGVHCTSVFWSAQRYLNYGATALCCFLGVLLHYLVPQLRKNTPWLLVAQPILRSEEHDLFDVYRSATLMCFERLFALFEFFERSVAYPILCIGLATHCGANFGRSLLSCLLIPLITLKILRAAYTNAAALYQPLIFAAMLTWLDLRQTEVNKFLPLNFYLLTILWPKMKEFILKFQFIVCYVAPWQLSWGSGFHAFAQPFAIPHSALVLAQTALSSVFSAPLNPFLGSSFFLTSYVRPVKFWERDYNTRRVDHSNTRLITHIDRGPMMDDSNLNAIFYEHLTRSLQKSLAGDLALGRWGLPVLPGDCFILASYFLNCLVHVVEVGNGFVTFQLRGLEFRGTYCQQREQEAISEDAAVEGGGCCCCEAGSLPGFLSFNTAWQLRWLAWEVTTTKYVIDGYSITDNSAISMLQVHELRRLLVSLYVRCIVYYAVMSAKLEEWLCTDSVAAELTAVASDEDYVDVDAIFTPTNDEDYDTKLSGVSRENYFAYYGDWIEYCALRRNTGAQFSNGPVDCDKDSYLCTLCYMLSLVGRRALAAASHNRHAMSAESFLYGLHALFKGDFRITSQRDEWVFADMDMLRCILAPAVKMALKLHQDHFTAADDFEEPRSLFDRIRTHENQLFISHEHDPAWRRAILDNTPSLLALRHVFDDGVHDYKIIMLNRRHLGFRVIKLNRECVRAFWAGQQQELIFLRNRNPERGSIQNARQVLRNIINSSADQPIGYPIYVSPLTTSFVETHGQMAGVLGPPLTPQLGVRIVDSLWQWLRQHFGMSGSSSLPTAAATAPAEHYRITICSVRPTGGRVATQILKTEFFDVATATSCHEGAAESTAPATCRPSTSGICQTGGVKIGSAALRPTDATASLPSSSRHQPAFQRFS